MRQLLIAVLIGLVCTKANASNTAAPPFDARDLQIRWEVVQNDYQNKAQSLMQSRSPIPARIPCLPADGNCISIPHANFSLSSLPAM